MISVSARGISGSSSDSIGVSGTGASEASGSFSVCTVKKYKIYYLEM